MEICMKKIGFCKLYKTKPKFFSVNAEAMITWEEFRSSMPWMVVLLVGGGFALAEGTKVVFTFLNETYTSYIHHNV